MVNNQTLTKQDYERARDFYQEFNAGDGQITSHTDTVLAALDAALAASEVDVEAQKALDALDGIIFSDGPGPVCAWVNEYQSVIRKGLGLLRSGREQWQPIESAPRDGTKILVWQNRKHWTDAFVASWVVDDSYEDGGHWFIHDGKHDHPLRGDNITHWQSLPAAPQPTDGGRDAG